MPGTVEELIGARLDRLGPQAKRVVQVAAVLGRQFHRDQLTRVLADEDLDVGALLAELEDRGVIHRASGGVPRLVNILAHKSMMLAFGEGVRQVSARQARAAIDDTPAADTFALRWGWLVFICLLASSGVGWLVLK